MNQDYLTYKKSKLRPETPGGKDPEKKMMSIFILTFVICFILVINIVSRYGKKMDIEYGRAIQPQDGISDLEKQNKNSNLLADFLEDGKSQVDSRLKLLQLEEIAPSEAKVIDKNKEKTVLDIDHYRKLIEEEKNREELEKTEKDNPPIKQAPAPVAPSFSKVLIGRFQSFDEARMVQNQLKEDIGAVTFIRKMGTIYSLQAGSYTDENTAQEVANKYSGLNYQVWILQD